MHERLQPLVAQRYLSVQQHPTLDLWIYNYTQKAQYERLWTDEILMCRGLILDTSGAIVSRPFPKFFNLEEKGPDWTPPSDRFEVTQKLDGSLGIMYQGGDGPCLATRGSFTSEQAEHANQILRQRYLHMPWNTLFRTYLFEIIYPENRIVVDYGELDDLILLGVIDTESGEECELPAWFPNHVTRYDGLHDLAALKGLAKANEEGFVVRFTTGERVKVKFDEYVRLHRLVTGVTARSLWEMLAKGGTLDELLERVPEEFEEWVKKTEADLRSRFAAIEEQCRIDFEQLSLGESRAAFAAEAKTRIYPPILFAMYDNKPYDHIIWKLTKPAAERPFKEADE